jgi:transcriptional regulator with XRE-family HTH domain
MPPEDDALPLVSKLRDVIRECGLSLNELGRRTGVSEGQLSRFLRGHRTLTLPAAARVCLYFGLNLCRGRYSDTELLDRKKGAHGSSAASKTRKR